MNKLRLTLILTVLSIICGLIFIPDWFEDPRELAPGDWKDSGRTGTLEVTDSSIILHGFGHRGTISYQWLQTESEPYTMQIVYGGHRLDAHITFDGPNTVIAELDIMDKLPAEAAKTLRSKNRSLGRPENEFRLVFFRMASQN